MRKNDERHLANREDTKIEVYVDSYNGYEIHRIICTTDENSTLNPYEKRKYMASVLKRASEKLSKEFESSYNEIFEYHFNKYWKDKPVEEKNDDKDEDKVLD